MIILKVVGCEDCVQEDNLSLRGLGAKPLAAVHFLQYFLKKAVSAAPAQFPTSNRCCTVVAGLFILLFNLLSLKVASLPEP